MTVALRPEIQFTPTGLVLPDDLPIEKWMDYGEHLFALERGVMWALGDWWRYGNHRYGERAAAALDSDRYAFQTFMDAAWVAGKVETSRRREVLSFNHHKEVAALDPDDQDYWLTEAVQGKWTIHELRGRVKRGKAPDGEEETPIEYSNPAWADLAGLMESLESLVSRDASDIATAVPSRRRATTAKRLRKLGTGLGRIAWSLEGMEDTSGSDV